MFEEQVLCQNKDLFSSESLDIIKISSFIFTFLLPLLSFTQISLPVYYQYQLLKQTVSYQKQYMNLHLPASSSHQPQSQTQQLFNKPRIAFMYQANIPSSPMAPIQPNYIHSFPDSNTKLNKNINANKSPQRVYNKQNQTASPAPLRVFEIPASHEAKTLKNTAKNSQSQCFKSQISNFSGLSRYNSPSGNTLPPLSPKISQRKSNSKCPSFLSNKNKNQEDQTIQVSPPTNLQAKFGSMDSCKCGKVPTHRTENNQKFCSKCSIKKMIEGIKLVQLQKIAESFNHPSPFDISTVSRSTGTRMSSSMNKTSDKFMKEVQQQKESLQKHYKQSVEGEDKNINIFYKERKTELKNHYQKIKMAIKESIEQDLKQLQLLERQQVQQWRRNANVLEDDIKQLQNIEASLRNDQQQKSFLIQENYMNLYQDIVSRNRLNRLSKGTRLAFDIDALSVSAIQNGNSNNTSNLNITIVLKNFNINAEVYRPEIYRMVSSNPNSERSSSRYSEIVPTNFQNPTGNQNKNLISYLVQPDQRNKHKVEVTQPYLNLNCNQKENNVLYSFEAKRRDKTY